MDRHRTPEPPWLSRIPADAAATGPLGADTPVSEGPSAGRATRPGLDAFDYVVSNEAGESHSLGGPRGIGAKQ